MSETIQESEKTKRLAALNNWAHQALIAHGEAVSDRFELVSASDDASFRRYFKSSTAVEATIAQRFVFVDAPPAHENNEAFLQINKKLGVAGVRVPKIYRSDLELGFLMIENFGDQLCLDLLQGANKGYDSKLVPQAIGVITEMQTHVHDDGLPVYDHALLNSEMCLFADWFVQKQLALKLSSEEINEIETIKGRLIESALEQPGVFVHRDFHSRNLMVLDDGELGVIDFQDAVHGPLTYDLVSLLKDCYFRFPRKDICNWVEMFRVALEQQGKLIDVGQPEFLKWFDLMGMQRHLKCAGIFSRLNLRDGKQRYLADIPLVLDYIVETCALYPELVEFGTWLEHRVLPSLVKSTFRSKTPF